MAGTEYYNSSGSPATRAQGSSAAMRAEYDLIEAAFDKLPTLVGVGNRVVHVNSGSTAMVTTSGFTFDGTTLSVPALTVSGAVSVVDSTFSIKDNADATKIGRFEMSGITTGNTRTLTFPNFDGTIATLAGTETLTNKTLTSPVIGTSPTAAGATWTNLGTVTTADINGGTVDGTVIGGASAAAGSFTTLSASGNLTTNVADTRVMYSALGVATGSANLTFNGTVLTAATGLTVGTTSGVLAHPDGTVAQPGLRVGTSSTTGVYSSADNSWHVSVNGVEGFRVDNAADVTIPSGDLFVLRSEVAGNVIVRSQNNDAANAASHARLDAIVNGAAAGDPYLFLSINGVTNWTIGPDNSDGDSLKIGPDSQPGSNTKLTITTAGAVTLAAGITATTGTFSGAVTVATLNGLTVTTSTGTLTVTNLKTLSVSNTLTLAGTDGTTITFQGTDTYVGRTTTDTLTNKTLTSPTINGGTLAGIDTLSLNDTDSAFNLTVQSTSTLTAGRTLTLDVDDAARTVRLGGNLTLAADFITSGANSLTLTTTGATNVTLPTSGTLATTAQVVPAATQAEMEAASSTSVYASPGRLHFHPGVAKGWAKWNSGDTIVASYNVAAGVDNGVGDFTIQWDTDFSSVNFAVSCVSTSNVTKVISQAAGDTRIGTYSDLGVTAQDATSAYCIVFGDQA